MFILCCYLRCKVTKTEFGIVGICRFLSVFVSFLNDAFSRCKVTKKDFVTVSLCQSMSLCVTLCHFPTCCLFLAAKLRKGFLALSPFVTICHLLSPFSELLFHAAKLRKRILALSAFVRICPEMSAFVRFLFRCKVTKRKIGTVQLCPFVSIYVHLCPATTWQCLIPFSLQSYEIEIWHCPNLSNYVQICPFNFVAISLSPHIVWNLRYSTLNESKDLP